MKKEIFRWLFLLCAVLFSAGSRGQVLHSSQNPTHTVHWGGEGLHSSAKPEWWKEGQKVFPVDSGHLDGAKLKKPEMPVGDLDVKKGTETVIMVDGKACRFYETGDATYYSARTHGKMMASGERYDRNGLFCAHKTLPFGTKLRVLNKKNGKEVIVIVKDRGPFSKGRIVDLSNKAAEVLGMLSAGVVPVEIWVIED